VFTKKRPDDELLMRYIDNQLDATKRQEVESRLSTDAQFNQRLKELQQSVLHINGALSVLSPEAQPNAGRALKKVNVRIEQDVMDKRNMMKQRTRRTVYATLVAALLVGSLALAPVRAFASNLLSVFRVESFVVVNVDEARLDEISAAIDGLDTENLIFVDQEVLEEPGEPVQVASIEEAESLLGYDLREAEGYGSPVEVMVTDGTRMRLTPDLASLQLVYSAVGLDPAIIPQEIDGQPFELAMEAGAASQYETEFGTSFVVMQAPAPTTNVPDGVDADALGIAVLQLLGMSESDAQSMANNIDFTTTLLLPIPTSELNLIREVSVDGTTGILFESDWDGEGQPVSLLWQKGGYVYSMHTDNGGTFALVDAANTLK